MAKAYPREFRDDVVAVARKSQSPLKQIAKDFGISEGSLHGWMQKADIEDGNRPGVTAADQSELREARKRIRLLEQKNEVLQRAAAYLSQANLPGKQIAEDFGVAEASLTNWLKKAHIEDGKRPGVTGSDQAENRELRKRLRLLEQENEVLRRAAAHLSQANLKLGGSPK